LELVQNVPRGSRNFIGKRIPFRELIQHNLAGFVELLCCIDPGGLRE
jgi:hypothetical protein